jgi:hypothetical protein
MRETALLQFFRGFNILSDADSSRRWSAVVCGAVAKGLEGDNRAVLKRKSRRHYETGCSELFKYRHHRESEAYFDSFSGAKYAGNEMSVLIKKGEGLHTSEDTHAKISLRSVFWVGQP